MGQRLHHPRSIKMLNKWSKVQCCLHLVDALPLRSGNLRRKHVRFHAGTQSTELPCAANALPIPLLVGPIHLVTLT